MEHGNCKVISIWNQVLDIFRKLTIKISFRQDIKCESVFFCKYFHLNLRTNLHLKIILCANIFVKPSSQQWVSQASVLTLSTPWYPHQRHGISYNNNTSFYSHQFCCACSAWYKHKHKNKHAYIYIDTDTNTNANTNAEKRQVSSMIEGGLCSWGRDHSRKSLLKANLIHLLFNFKAQIPSAFSFNLNAKLIHFDFNSKADNPVQIQFLELKHGLLTFQYHSTMFKESLTQFVKDKMQKFWNTWWKYRNTKIQCSLILARAGLAGPAVGEVSWVAPRALEARPLQPFYYLHLRTLLNTSTNYRGPVCETKVKIELWRQDGSSLSTTCTYLNTTQNFSTNYRGPVCETLCLHTGARLTGSGSNYPESGNISVEFGTDHSFDQFSHFIIATV